MDNKPRWKLTRGGQLLSWAMPTWLRLRHCSARPAGSALGTGHSLTSRGGATGRSHFFSVVLLKVGIHWHDRKQGPDFFFQNLRRKFSVTTWSLGPTASVSMLPWTSVRNAGNGESLWTFGIRCHRGVFREASFRLEVLSVPWREHWAREIWGVHSS
jgi:hypothetical protein